jgi:hypothetical protein
VKRLPALLASALLAVVAAPAAHATTYAFDDFSDATGSDGTPDVGVPDSPDHRTWGPADVGGTWGEFSTRCDGSPEAFRVTGGEGVVATDNAAAEHDCQYLDIGQESVEFQGTISVSTTPAGGSVWGYLGVRVQDRDNAYRVRVAFTSADQAQCLMQEEAADVTTTFPATGATKTLSATDYSGAGDHVNVKIQADASADTVKGKCWSAPESEPESWDWMATGETTLEGSGYNGIQIRTTTAPGVTNDPSIRFDDLDAHSIGHVDPKVAAVGDISCKSSATSFNGGLGLKYVSTSTSNWHKDRVAELAACHQRWTSDLVCGTGPTCDSSYDAIVGLGDFQYDCAMIDDYLGSTSAWSFEWFGNHDSWRRVTDSGKWYPAVGNHEYSTDTAPALSLVDECGLTDWVPRISEPTDFDPGECYYQVFNGTRPGGATGDGITTPCDPATTGIANPDGNMGTRPDGETVIGGFYTFDVGTWRFIVLNSGEGCNELGPECDDGIHSDWASWGNDQADYLDYQLDTNTQPCVAVAFHYPRWSSDGPSSAAGDWTGHGDALQTWWDITFDGLDENANDHRVDLVLNGHDHFYERFGKMDDSGAAAPSNGIHEFIVGTGGKSIRGVRGASSGVSQAKNPVLGDSPYDLDENGNPDTLKNDYPNKTAGVLELVMKPNGYQYRFRPSSSHTKTNGNYTDPAGGGLSSEVSCNADGS